MPDGVIIEVESSSHYLGSFSEKNDSFHKLDRKDHGGCRYSLDGFSRSINSPLFAEEFMEEN